MGAVQVRLCNVSHHGGVENRRILGVDCHPVYVVSTDADVWSVTEEQYMPDTNLKNLMQGLRSDQHVYLVHLGEHKLTQLI
jgi:hypothetical protein